MYCLFHSCQQIVNVTHWAFNYIKSHYIYIMRGYFSHSDSWIVFDGSSRRKTFSWMPCKALSSEKVCSPPVPSDTLADDWCFDIHDPPPRPKLFPVIVYISEQTNVRLDNDFHYEPTIIYCYYTLLLSNNCQLRRSARSPKLLLFPSSPSVILPKHFKEIVLLCAQKCVIHT